MSSNKFQLGSKQKEDKCCCDRHGGCGDPGQEMTPERNAMIVAGTSPQEVDTSSAFRLP